MRKMIIVALIPFWLTACSEALLSPSNTPKDVVQSLWKYIDENYVFLDYKAINWESKRALYANKANAGISKDSLFSLCSSMLAELKDGHNYLKDGKKTYQYNYQNGYEVVFNLNKIKTQYLKSGSQSLGNYTSGIIADSIGYVYLEKFNGAVNFKPMMQAFKTQKVSKIIIDLRNNGGGLPEVAQTMVGYFVNKPTLIGSITHKRGKAHDDFSTKIDLKAIPQSTYFDQKVRILINRNSFSASSYFAAMMQHLPNVKLIGQITGGGGGAAAAYELPNRWVVGITSNFFLDSKGKQIENGVSPSIEIENKIEDLTDKMLEKAIEN